MGCSSGGRELDERPANEKEWGFRPAEGAISNVNPPSFSWRPQKEIVSWELEVGRGLNMQKIEYRTANIDMNVHCPARVFPAGTYTWRYRGVDSTGTKTKWSVPRTFSIAVDAVALPMPGREELINRISKIHPRLFVRPEDLPKIREAVKTTQKAEYDLLIKRCEALLNNPPSGAEPLKYPEGMVRYGYDWTRQWWGNRLYVIETLDGAATLGFAYQISGNKQYGELAKEILLKAAEWDPYGASGYRYNDEAGMPYIYHFSRAYTYVYDLLSEKERNICRNVAAVRGKQMYEHLFPRQLWDAYVSHNARAWHFLGEMALAFMGEVEGAEDWLWFAMNVTYNVYPIWSDDQGGWHEGFSYWHSYMGRFKWWALAIRSAMNVDIFKKPFFSQETGYYAMYLMPPGRDAAEFGDGSIRVRETNIVPLFGEGTFLREQAVNAVPLMSRLAAESGNSHWQWYVEKMGGPVEESGYLALAQPLPKTVESKPPVELPSSRLFKGIGLACLNTTLLDAKDNVQLIFKSSPMGTQSHGIESNNTFAIWAYGQRMLIRTGHYYMYGCPHHDNWVWDTQSQNNITVNGKGQVRHSPFSKGKIIAFKTTPTIDYVVGEAGSAYRTQEGDNERQFLNRFTRSVIFIKPELFIIYDRLEAPEPSTFEYRLHAINKFHMPDQQNIKAISDNVICDINIMVPEKLKLSQTDQYDPNPWPQITVRDWHLVAATNEKSSEQQFITTYRLHEKNQIVPQEAEVTAIEGGYLLKTTVTGGQVVVLLPLDDKKTLQGEGLETTGNIIVRYQKNDKSPDEVVEIAQKE
jgi:hypothetical protein